jgi:ankyrin repeat protein
VDLTPDELAFLQETFELARVGRTGDLVMRLDKGVPVNLTNGKGDTLLTLAAYHDHVDTVRELLDRGADHSRTNDRGQTALGAAVFRRSHDGVRALLDQGADPAGGSPSALEVAAFFELPEMTALLEAGARR